jgi:hypothetical protein
MLSSLLVPALILIASACIDEPEPELEATPPRAPPEGTLVYEGECARVYQSFEGYTCQGTAERFDARACLVRDYLGGGPDTQRVDLYLANDTTALGDWCDQQGLAGCAGGPVAFSHEDSMNHEIVHALVAAITGHHAHSIIDEGLAHMLDGRANRIFYEVPDLELLFAANSGRTHRDAALSFVGWMLMTFGPEVVMEVAHDAPLHSSRAELAAALSEHLGMSIDEIIEAHQAELIWTYPELPPLPPPVRPEQWAGGIDMTLDCSDASTQGLTGEVHMWRTIDFVVDEPGRYLLPYGDADRVSIVGVCEEPYFEEGEPPCEDMGFVHIGLFSHLKLDLEPGRRYRARIDATYPGPVNYTFLPMLGAEP